MAEVKEIKLDDYKTFYKYYNDKIIVYVNSQDQFEAGQKDVGSERCTLTEQQAEEARTLEARNVEGVLIKTLYRDALKLNGFDLEKE